MSADNHGQGMDKELAAAGFGSRSVAGIGRQVDAILPLLESFTRIPDEVRILPKGTKVMTGVLTVSGCVALRFKRGGVTLVLILVMPQETRFFLQGDSSSIESVLVAGEVGVDHAALYKAVMQVDAFLKQADPEKA
jgi:hypothetical protein